MKRKFIKSANGIGIIEILVAVAVLAIVGAGIYLYVQQSQSSDNESGLTKQEQEEMKALCKVQIDDDLLCAAFTKWGGVSSEPVTYKTTMTDENGDKNTVISKYDGDDYHSIMNHDGEAMESMKLGNVHYTKMEGEWYKQTLESSDADIDNEMDSNPASQMDEYFGEDVADDVSYKRLGNESCGDVSCVKYEITYSSEPDTVNYFWVNPKDQKVMRMLMEEKDGSSWDMVFEYGPVSITAPANAKDFSEMYAM